MEEQELKKELKVIDKKASDLSIRTPEDYTLAGNIVLQLDDMIKKVKEYWKDPKEKAYQAHKAITAKEAEMLKPLNERRVFLSKRLSDYATEQKRIQAENQRKLDEERKRQEEAERKKLEKKAEKAEAKGQDDVAEVLRDQAENVYVPPVIAQADVDKTTRTDAGTFSQIEDIEVFITDLHAVMKAIAEGTLPTTIVTVNGAKLKQVIKINGYTSVPGVEIRKIVRTSYRGAK